MNLLLKFPSKVCVGSHLPVVTITGKSLYVNTCLEVLKFNARHDTFAAKLRQFGRNQFIFRMQSDRESKN